jgi:hypothetical protein
MRRFYPIAILVVILAGLFGSILSGNVAVTHVRDYMFSPEYRAVIALENQWEYLDIQGLGLETSIDGEPWGVAYLSSTDYDSWTQQSMNAMSVDVLNMLIELYPDVDVVILSFVSTNGYISFEAFCPMVVYTDAASLNQCRVSELSYLAQPLPQYIPWAGRAPF